MVFAVENKYHGLEELMVKCFYEATSIPMFFVNVEGIIVFANKVGAQLLDKDDDTVIGESADILPGLKWEDQSLVPVPEPFEINGKWFQISASPLDLDGLSCAGSLVEYMDITELHHSKQTISEMNDIIEAVSDGIYVTDGQGNTLRINSACQQITGLIKEKVMGQNMRTLVQKGLLSASCSLKVLETKQRTTILQNTPSGKTVIVTGTPVFDEKGEIKRIISSTRDITELNQLKSLLEKERQLSHRYYSELLGLKMKHLNEFQKDFIAYSEKMFKIVEMAMRVARTDSTVTITGESGVGKEVIARLIHNESSRAKEPFMKINCAAIPDSLLESELFGYEKGAFTGARKGGKPGLIELANNGTLFLDEIGEMSLNLQAKLLQVIQEKSFIRVGGSGPIHVNIRIVVATNQDLVQLVEQGKFRKDLYFRLNVIPINIPPLRERTDGIPPLVYRFLSRCNVKYGMNKMISSETVDILQRYSWPGNIRELENLIEQLVIITPGNCIMPENLPAHIRQSQNQESNKQKIVVNGIPKYKEALEEVEKQLYLKAYQRHNNTYKIAEALGVSQPTVVRKLKKYRMYADEFI
jgi:PAS domain S-box-containing protein